MKKVIRGKIYSTETAKLVGSWDNGLPRDDFNHLEEALYKKKTGEFFLYGNGGARTWCSIADGDGRIGGCKIAPFSDELAREWCEKHLDADAYETFWGSDEDEENGIQQRIRDLIARVGSQREFSVYLGIPISTVENWAQGLRHCPSYVLDLIDFRISAKKTIARVVFIDNEEGITTTYTRKDGNRFLVTYANATAADFKRCPKCGCYYAEHKCPCSIDDGDSFISSESVDEILTFYKKDEGREYTISILYENGEMFSYPARWARARG